MIPKYIMLGMVLAIYPLFIKIFSEYADYYLGSLSGIGIFLIIIGLIEGEPSK